MRTTQERVANAKYNLRDCKCWSFAGRLRVSAAPLVLDENLFQNRKHLENARIACCVVNGLGAPSRGDQFVVPKLGEVLGER